MFETGACVTFMVTTRPAANWRFQFTDRWRQHITRHARFAAGVVSPKFLLPMTSYCCRRHGSIFATINHRTLFNAAATHPAATDIALEFLSPTVTLPEIAVFPPCTCQAHLQDCLIDAKDTTWSSLDRTRPISSMSNKDTYICDIIYIIL